MFQTLTSTTGADMNTHDKHGGDSLSDFGFFWVTILIFAVFAAVMYWGFPHLSGGWCCHERSLLCPASPLSPRLGVVHQPDTNATGSDAGAPVPV